MQRLWYVAVWLRRIGHCRGFGIQSPNDYWLVRYVINEHWPYYQYDEIGQGDDWLTQKLGRLYFRVANWLQPSTIISDGYLDYLQAGCRRAIVSSALPQADEHVGLVRLTLKGDYRERLANIYNKVDERSVLIVEDIRSDSDFWRRIVADERTGVTFDLYYCGIVLFDKKRAKKNYIINF